MSVDQLVAAEDVVGLIALARQKNEQAFQDFCDSTTDETLSARYICESLAKICNS